MRKRVIMLMLAGLVPVVGFSKVGPMRFRTEIKPIGGILSSDIDELGIRYTRGGWMYSETIDGSGSYMGTIQIGLELDTAPCFIDLLFGGGLVGNEGFGSGLFTGDIGFRFKLDKEGTFAIGPFFGVIVPTDAEWEVRSDGDEGTMDLTGNTGIQGGIKLTGGWENFCLVLQLGYAQYGYDMDADNPGDWEVRRDNGTWLPYASADHEIEMDGFFGQFGVTAQF